MALKSLLARLTRVDRWLVLLTLAGTVVSLYLSLGRPVGRQVVVYLDEKIVFAGPLDQTRTIPVEGPLGETRIEIGHGKARVLSSPCPRKICIGMGAVGHSGDLLACVPNHVTLRIEGEKDDRGYDLLSR